LDNGLEDEMLPVHKDINMDLSNGDHFSDRGEKSDTDCTEARGK